MLHRVRAATRCSSRRLALSATTLEFRGYIDHEPQHAAQKDHRKVSAPRFGAAIALLFGPLVLVVVLVIYLLTAESGPDRVTLVWLATLVLLVGALLAMRWAFILLYRRDDGLSSYAVELRDDLPAARVVGRRQ